MRVLVAAEAAPRSGSLTYLLGLLGTHRRLGIETVVLLAREHAHPDVADAVRAAGAAVRLGPRRPALFGKACLSLLFDRIALAGALREERPDLVVVSSTTLGPLLGVFGFPVPAVVVLHTAPEGRLRPGMRHWLRRRLGRGRRLATVSRFAARRVARCWGVPEEAVAVVPNAAPALPEAPPPPGPPLVLTLAAAVDYKDPRTWMRVARLVHARVPGARFAWVGDGGLLPAMRADAAPALREGWLELPGGSDDPAAWLRRARVYLQPSRRESQGVAVLEAMAHGLPCVVSDAGGLPESVVDGGTGFVVPAGDAEGFAGRIVTLLRDPALAAGLGAAGRERARALFSREAQERAVAALYAAVLAAREQGG